MSKGILGAFASLIFAVVVLGFIFWDLHQESHQLMLESEHLDILIDQQRESLRETLYSTRTN